MSASVLLARLPLFFLGSAGLLAHFIFQKDRRPRGVHPAVSSPTTIIMERIKYPLQITTILWLTSTLSLNSSSDTTTSMAVVYLHGLFASSMACILITAILPHATIRNSIRRRETSFTNHNTTRDSYHDHSRNQQHDSHSRIIRRNGFYFLAGAMESLVPGCWTGLLVETCFIFPSADDSIAWVVSILGALVVFVGSCWVRWTKSISSSWRGGQYMNPHQYTPDEQETPIITRSGYSSACCPYDLPVVATTWSSNNNTANRRDSSSIMNSGERIQDSILRDHSSSISQREFDEANWFHWGVDETLVWIYETMMSREQQAHAAGDEQEDTAAQTIVTLLGPEEITCWQLAQLKAADLRLATGLPLGLACQLKQHIQHKLQDRYPVPGTAARHPHQEAIHDHRQPNASVDSTTTNHSTTASFSDSWLAQHDQEYNRSSPPAGEQRTVKPTAPHHPEQFHVSSSDRAYEQMNTVMRDKFGLELPKARDDYFSGGLPVHNRSPDDVAPVPTAQSLSTTTPFATSQDNNSLLPKQQAHSSSSLAPLPPDFLANMPPHISEIVRRKPHLVQQILEQQKRKRAKPPPLNIRPEEDRGGLESLATLTEENDPEDDGSDGEMTELLRYRRRGAQESPTTQQYKSTS